MKKLLLSLFVGLFTLIGFGYCGVNIEFLAGNGNEDFLSADYIGVDSGTFVFYVYGDGNYTTGFSYDSSENSYTYEISFSGNNNTGNCELMSSLDCQLNYSLIPVSSIDQSYCVSNNLCPDYIGTGEDLERSNIYINDIFHPGKPFINVNIPDYISWSYISTGDYFNLDVGTGYDLDYINSVVSINSYRPTSEDFTNIFVSGLTFVMPYIVILLFIVFIWKFIKRIFK